MQVSVETTQGLERRMTVALPSEDIDSAVMERLQSLSKTTRINGFRPGKVPFKVVKKRYEPQVRSEVLGSMINRSYFDALKQPHSSRSWRLVGNDGKGGTLISTDLHLSGLHWVSVSV